MHQYPIGTPYYCPYQMYFTTLQPFAELNTQFNSSYTCPRYKHHNGDTYPPTLKFSKSQVNLMNKMRKLWEQHDVWTRSTIESIVFDLPDVDLVTQRLLRNPTDFRNALAPLYGSKIASKFSDLLKAHLVIAAELVKAAKASNNQAAADAEKRWYANADEIAAFLGRINPYWSEEEWKSMLHEHLALVKSEAVSMLTKDYASGIEVYDRIEDQSLRMGDMLASGIIRQFPNKFIE